MSRIDLSRVRSTVRLAQFTAEPIVLLEVVRERITTRAGASAVGSEPWAQASDVLRAQPKQARFGSGQRMAGGGVRPRSVHLSGVRASRRTPERRSHSALWATPRTSIRVVERADAMRALPQKNADLRLARLLAQTPLVEIAAERMAQAVLL